NNQCKKKSFETTALSSVVEPLIKYNLLLINADKWPDRGVGEYE
ncbi:23705_t:CDS:1, partial [Gigaspora rosea]